MSRPIISNRNVAPALACGQRPLHMRRYVSTMIAWIHFSDADGMRRLRNRAHLSSRRRSLRWIDLASHTDV